MGYTLDDLKYAFIDEKKIYPVIISAKLSGQEEDRLLEVLRVGDMPKRQ